MARAYYVVLRRDGGMDQRDCSRVFCRDFYRMIISSFPTEHPVVYSLGFGSFEGLVATV